MYAGESGERERERERRERKKRENQELTSADLSVQYFYDEGTKVAKLKIDQN